MLRMMNIARSEYSMLAVISIQPVAHYRQYRNSESRVYSLISAPVTSISVDAAAVGEPVGEYSERWYVFCDSSVS